MTRPFSRWFWLFAPFAVLTVADAVFTLHGQPPEYHGGDRSTAVEANPVARQFLVWGPSWFLAGGLAWIGGLGVVAAMSSSRWVARATAAAALAHAFGGASWLFREGGWGWVVAPAYFLVAAATCRYCWRRAGLLSAPGLPARP